RIRADGAQRNWLWTAHPRGDEVLYVRRPPCPRVLVGVVLEAAHQADPRLDSRPLQRPRKLLIRPAFQHLLEDLLVRPQQPRGALDQEQRCRTRDVPRAHTASHVMQLTQESFTR